MMNDLETKYKSCPKCNKILAIENFRMQDSRTNNRQSYCIECNKEYQRQHYLNNKQRYRDRNLEYESANKEIVFEKLISYLKEHPCAVCGKDEIIMLEFDHLDPTEKSFTISERATNGKYNWDHIWREVQKCQVLCVECHRRRTAEQFGWKKFCMKTSFRLDMSRR